VILLISAIVSFTAWKLIAALNTRKESVTEKEAARTVPVMNGENPTASPTPLATIQKPALKLAPPLVPDPKPAGDAAKKAKEAEEAKAAAIELAVEMKKTNDEAKKAAVELAAEMKKTKDEAKEAAVEATAKDIGLRSEVKNDFLTATRMIQSFFIARSEGEIERLIRHPKEVMPKYREWTKSHGIERPGKFQTAPKFITTDRFLLIGVPMADGSSRLAAFEKVDKATLRLDWESFAGWCESQFADVPKLASNRQVLMRVNAQRSASTPPFPVKEGGLAFTLSHPDEQTTLSAYLPAEVLSRGDKAARYLAGMQKRGMVTLKIFVDDECRLHGWAKIAAVPNVGWVSEMPMEAGSTILPK
jgi:hypothetical protein